MDGYQSERSLSGVRSLACGGIGDGKLGNRCFAAAIGKKHGNGSALRGCDGDCHILQRELGKAGIGPGLYVAGG